MKRLSRPLAVLVLGLAAAPAWAAPPKPLEFHLTFDGKAHPGAFTGRVYVLLSKREMTALPASPNWFRPEPFLAADVRDWRPGEKLALVGNKLAYPEPLA